MLQWGHVVVDVEGVARGKARKLPSLASMGPRRRRRGRSSGMLLPSPYRSLQWGHVVVDVEGNRRPAIADPSASFNGATSSSTWKVPVVFVLLELGGRFNGATSSSTWKGVSTREVILRLVRASMGPRRRRRGRRAGRSRPRRSGLRRFNGATSSSTWKVKLEPDVSAGRGCASMGPRRPRRGRHAGP